MINDLRAHATVAARFEFCLDEFSVDGVRLAVGTLDQF